MNAPRAFVGWADAPLAIEWRVGGSDDARGWTLRWIIEPGSSGRVVIRGEQERSSGATPLSPSMMIESEWVIDPFNGWAHLSAGDHLQATFKPQSDGGWALVYAHTDALARLGVVGGQTEAPIAAKASAQQMSRSLAS